MRVHVPDTVPVFVDIVETGQLRIPLCPAGIDPEQEGPTTIAVAVDQDRDIVVS
jgi:hypothetical protein